MPRDRPAPRPPAGGRRPGECGQASVEHAAIVLLVALVLAGAAGAAAGFSGVGIVNAVHSGIRRAICVAGADGCEDFHVRQPCAVALEEDRTSKGLSLGIWRVGKDRSVAVERRSDGTVAVTLYDDLQGGVGSSVGVRFGIGRSSSGDDGPALEASAGVEGRLRGGWGRTWELPDAASAAALVRSLAAKDGVRAPDVDRVRLRADQSLRVGASGPLGVDAEGSFVQGLSGEGTQDRRTGRITVSLAVSRAASVDLAGPLGLKLGASVALEPSATLTLDRDLRPRELRLVGRADAQRGAVRRDVQLRVDLTRPAVAAGLSELLRGLVSADVARARSSAVALGRWAADEGWIDQREYATESETDGFDAEIGLGLKLGARNQDTHSSERLLSARSRPPGGLWEDRTDCAGRS